MVWRFSRSETVAVLDVEGRFVTAGPDFSDFLCLVDGEFLGLLPKDLKTPFDMQLFQEALLWVIAKKTGKSLKLSKRAMSSGYNHIVDFVPEIGNAGNLDYITVYGRILSDFELLNFELIDTQEQLSAAIKVMPDIFWIKDLDGRYKVCNDKFHHG